MPKDKAKKTFTIRIPATRPCGHGGGPEVTACQGAGNSSTGRGVDFDDGKLRTPTSNQLLVAPKEYCCFCGDLMGDKRNVCVGCGAYVCEQSRRYGRGCIYFGTVKANAPFRCNLCDMKHWRGQKNRPSAGLPYGFLGYGGRKRAKLTWPLLLVNMTLAASFESFISDALKLDFKQEYIASPNNLELIDIELKGNAQTAALKKMEPAHRFIAHSLKSMVPVNAFLVLDTHADTLTGGLQWAGGVTGVQVAPVSEVLSSFCGKRFMSAMKQAAEAARGFVSPENPGWYKDSPFYRGGWRVLFLTSCGPAVRVREGFKDLRQLVERDEFDLVLAFGGSSTISNYVKELVRQAIEGIGVDKTCDIWETISRVAGRDLKLLQMNSVVVIYRERGGGVMCRQIALHSPPLRAWGLEFSACGSEGCRPGPYDFDIRDSDGKVRVTCRVCLWRSASLRAGDLKGLLFRLSSTVPDVFWHEYPPCMELQNAFVRITKERAAGEATGG